MANQPAVSVVIPTYQRSASILRLLHALDAQNLPSDAFEVVIAIDGSNDDTREVVASYPARYTLEQRWQPNRGRAAACNLGLHATHGTLTVILDDDMEPLPGCLQAHLEAHAGRARLGVVGAVPVVVSASSPAVVQYIAQRFERHATQLAAPAYSFVVRDFYSGNFSIARSELLAAGGFDETFTVYGNEDIDLWMRLTQRGVSFSFSAAATARQHYTKSTAALAHDNRDKGRTAVMLAAKHPALFPGLKLHSYRQGSRRWRFVRAALLRFSSMWTGTPGAVVRGVQCVERREGDPQRLFGYYDLAMDYFFWLGARAELRARGTIGSSLRALDTYSKDGSS